MHRRDLALFLLIALGTLPLAGCSPKLPDPATAVKAATARAAEAKTVHMEMSVDIQGADVPEDLLGSSRAGFDFENDRWFVISQTGGLESEMRGVDGKVYIRLLGEDDWFFLGDEDDAES